MKTALIRRFKLLFALATVVVVGSFGIGSGSSAFGATSYPPFTDPMLLVNWNVDASTHIKKLNQDVTVPRGSFVGLIDLKTGSILGLLSLPPAHMSLKALGLLPLVEADFQMAPVGPITRVWPTSPTWRAKRNGVEPSVRPWNSGGPSRWVSRSGPAQTAESGIMWARFRVETGGCRTLA